MSKSKSKKEEALYKIKPGVLIRHKGKSITSHNVTDKIAKEILAENMNRKVLFVKLPKEWQKEVGVEINTEAEEVKIPAKADSNQENLETSSEAESSEKPSLEERKAELDDMHYSKIADLVEALGHDYSLLKKDKSIEAILKAEYPEKDSE
jgi:hypothetical protein